MFSLFNNCCSVANLAALGCVRFCIFLTFTLSFVNLSFFGVNVQERVKLTVLLYIFLENVQIS